METNPRGGWRRYGLLLLGAAILAFGLFNIHSRCRITEGGVLGTTLLLQHWLGISPGISGVVLDIACYLMGLRMLGKAFLRHALFTSAAFSLCYNVFERVGYLLPDLSARPLLAAVLGGCFVGVGIVVRQGGASGGDDALALVISKLARCRISFAYFFTDFVVLLCSLSYIPLRRIAYSLLTVTISSALIDGIQRFPFRAPAEQ